MAKMFPSGYINDFDGNTLWRLLSSWQQFYARDPNAVIKPQDWPSKPTDYEQTDVAHSISLTCGRCTDENGRLSKTTIAYLERLPGQWTARKVVPQLFWFHVQCPTCSLSLDLRSIQVQARIEEFLSRKQIPRKTQLSYLAGKIENEPLTAEQLEGWLHRPPGNLV